MASRLAAASIPHAENQSATTAQAASSSTPASQSQQSQTQPSQPSPSSRGMPHYEKIRRDLRSSLQKRQALEDKLQKLDNSLLNYERQYLEENPGGNIIKGFDNYVKYMSGGGGAGRRKGGFTEADRVFSRSGGFGLGVDDSGSGRSTPSMRGGLLNSNGNLNTPTTQSQPQSGGGIQREAPSNHATPGSTSSANGKASVSGAAGTPKIGVKRTAGGEDSETDSAQSKKIKVNFGAVPTGVGGRK